MASEQDYDNLLKKRSTIKGKLTLFANFLHPLTKISQITASQITELQIRLEKLEALYETYDGLQTEIEVSGALPDEQLKERELFETKYYNTLAAARDIVNQHRPSNPKSEVSSDDAIPITTRVKLPTINLPHFSGGYKNWLEFKDLFKSLIHENNALDNITKFHYLRTSLHGSAAIIIESLDFRADNYYIAWKTICERYDNTQHLVNNHVQALFNIEPVHKESSQALRQIVDVTNKNLRALATLAQPVQHWDTLIIHIMASKLDATTRRHWEEHKITLTEPPTLEAFTKYLNSRSNLLESMEEAKGKLTDKDTTKQKALTVTSKPNNSEITCPLCNEKGHFLYNCEKFRTLDTESRLAKAKHFKVCLNCLRPGHTEAKCKLGHCKYCKVKHNTLLHKESEKKSTYENVSLSANNCLPNSHAHVLLSTALVRVRDNEGQPHRARVLLDNGSTANFISQDLYSKLHLPTRMVHNRVLGINNQECNSTQACSLQIESLSGDYNTNIDCFIMPVITTQTPHTYIDRYHIPIPSGICLADPSFNVPSAIDILVGADIFWSVIGTNRIQLGKNNPVLHETKLGWLMSGTVHQPSHTKPVCMFVHDTDTHTDTDITRFWELDTINPIHNHTKEENLCEDIFMKTTKRNEDGRFVVTIPLKEPPEVLGNSYDMAKRRFYSLERRFEKDPIYKKRYVEFMKEHEATGRMTENTHYISSNKSCFLPHHGVTRESSTTTKLRVVFDASAKTSSGKSLNDIQMVGPTVQDDLLSILLRFRQHQVVVHADIEKFFLSIEVDKEQRSLQQVLWRADPSQRLKRYTLNTVTFGTASASFLSTRCLLELAKEASAEPEVQRALAHDFYVDDYLGGADSAASAIGLCHNINKILKSAQLNLRKWQSSEMEVVEAVSTLDTTNMSVDLSAKELSKTLGLSWQCVTDTLTFSLTPFLQQNTTINKRHVLSTVAQVFDPLGLVSPCIVEAKILMQRLWMEKCSWDEELPDIIKHSWINFALNLQHLNNISIPRCVICKNSKSIQLHIFTDASEKAYGCAVYVRTVATDSSVTVRLLASKSKVAPIKPTTIPRLELCGALLGARLCTKVLSSLTLTPEQCTFWCDSTIVLGWLSSTPSHLKTFVRNRVCEIQEASSQATWRYVPSKENPADLVSRGLSANFISGSALWWSGPAFLAQDPASWPGMPNTEQVLELPETIHTFHTSHDDVIHDPIKTLIENTSSFSKLQRVVAYVCRWIHNCRTPQHKHVGALTTSELISAHNTLIRSAQRESFPTEYALLEAGKELPHKSRLKSLTPYLDKGIIRVGGRLYNSSYDYNVKHPILLCGKHSLTRLIFTKFHLSLFHAGPQLLLATIRQQYWPLGGRSQAKQVVRTCIRCLRFKGENIQPIMGNLPKERTQLEFPFLETGTDYAGPILIADRKGRGCRLLKSYICIFVCLATKALHLELVSDLSKEAFIAALNRFISRRGKPNTIYSDNGTTFVGSFNELAQRLQQNSTLEFTEVGINFSFIPAYTPHFGGLWESAVKSVKHHLRRVLGLTHLTYEEMSTCLIQIEAILNSRPLTALSDDPYDMTPLTPAHFLIGRSLMTVPHAPLDGQASISSLPRFQRVEKLRQHFWSRFVDEYISSLQEKSKWHHSTGRLQEGDLVLVKEKNVPPLMWPLGRVVQLHPGRDGIARVADIRTKKGILRRAYHMICPLHNIVEDTSTPGACSGNTSLNAAGN